MALRFEKLIFLSAAAGRKKLTRNFDSWKNFLFVLCSGKFRLNSIYMIGAKATFLYSFGSENYHFCNRKINSIVLMLIGVGYGKYCEVLPSFCMHFLVAIFFFLTVRLRLAIPSSPKLRY